MLTGPPAPTSDIVIVLATYNGAEHLRQQLASIRMQRRRDWTLLVRDDGSSDATMTIVEDAAATDPRIVVLRDDGANLGVRANFSRLAAAALDRGARYVCFADQDDIWHDDRIEAGVRCVQEAEARVGPHTPVLAHSDLELIDHEGRTVQASFMRFQHIRHDESHPFRTLLVQNFVTGCTMTVNRALLDVALPVPDASPMHDWWFALCAAACGEVVCVPRPTVAYRRHGRNTVPVRGFWRTLNPFFTDWKDVWTSAQRTHGRAVQQTVALLARLEATSAGQPARVSEGRAFVALHHAARLSRLRLAVALGLRSQSWPRTVALYLRIAAGPPGADAGTRAAA